MREVIARVLGLEIGRVSVKATTHERLGALGKGEGCAAYAVALIQSV
jgi:2-C-methyl-D-erythritol 2,4-cyclodiphosphate synthase